MHLEISKLVCSLCKNEYVLENSTSSLTTQLCPECRSIIDTIRPVQRNSGALSQPGVNVPSRIPSPVPSGAYKSAQVDSVPGDLHIELPPAALDSPGAEPLDTGSLNSGSLRIAEHRQPSAPTTGNGSYPAAAAEVNDHSEEHQWTLVVGEERRRLWPAFRVALVVILILACAAAGYLYVVRLKNKANTPSQAAGNAEPVKAATSKTGNAAKPGSESAPLLAAAHGSDQQQSAKPLAAEPRAKEEPAAAGKLVTLQAASFPNEAAATAFSERLVKAGVPSYVIGADVPHKGRWYRVRAGKFDKAEDARGYIAAWQKRAAAAGVSIQLIVLDYEKP